MYALLIYFPVITRYYIWDENEIVKCVLSYYPHPYRRPLGKCCSITNISRVVIYITLYAEETFWSLVKILYYTQQI